MTLALRLLPVLAQLFVAQPAQIARFDGNHALDAATLRAALEHAAHDESDAAVENQGFWVLSAYYDRGFADARVVPSVTLEGGVRVVTFRIHEGVQYLIGHVTVTGDSLGFVTALPADGAPFVRSVLVRSLGTAKQRYRESGHPKMELKVRAHRDEAQRRIDLFVELSLPERE